MKTRHIVFYTALLLIVCSFTKGIDPSFRIIVDDEFTHEFHISLDKSVNKPSKKRQYFWYKSGEIHNTHGGVHGKLLIGKYKKLYVGNQLAETGTFSKGLKVKTWKSWYKNGHLRNLTEWQNGRKNGAYEVYSNNGLLELKGHYVNDKKAGRWVSYTSKDTIFYRAGKIITKKESERKEPSKFKKVYSKIFKKKKTKTKKAKKKKKAKSSSKKLKKKKSNVKS